MTKKISAYILHFAYYITLVLKNAYSLELKPMSKKSKKKKANNPWRWQLDILLLLLTVSIMLWIVAKVQLIDMSRVVQAYLPPIEEPTEFTASAQQRNQWLEAEAAVINPLIQKAESQQAKTAKDIAEQQDSTIIASVTEPKARKQVETWNEIAPKKPVSRPKPNYVTSTEKIDKKVALTPTDEIF